jgi:cytochrome P450
MRGYPDVPDWLPLPSHQRYLILRRLLSSLADRLIANRRTVSEDPDDLLSTLLGTGAAAGGRSLTDNELRAEVLVYLLAGHEVGPGLTWTWYLLARHPRVEQRLQAKLAAVLGGRAPTVEDLPRLKYTEMVFQEALRLYPPVWSFTRSALRDDEIGGYFIPAGSIIYLAPYLTHRHPAFWENPERFEPERFEPSRSVDRPTLAYFPFSGGARACIGARLAMTEGQLVLATVAQRFRLRLRADRPVAPTPWSCWSRAADSR